jgi:hypothetical protein
MVTSGENFEVQTGIFPDAAQILRPQPLIVSRIIDDLEGRVVIHPNPDHRMFPDPGLLLGRQLDNTAFFSCSCLTVDPDSHKRKQGHYT